MAKKEKKDKTSKKRKKITKRRLCPEKYSKIAGLQSHYGIPSFNTGNLYDCN